LPLFPPAGGRQPPNYLVPVHDVCSTLSQNFTPIAPSCVEISSTVQTKKQKKTKKSKLNITPNATLYGEIKKLNGNFGYMGRSNPWGDLDQMWLVGRYGGRNHVCNISWPSVKGCRCGDCWEGISLPSAIDLTCRPYKNGDRVISASNSGATHNIIRPNYTSRNFYVVSIMKI